MAENLFLGKQLALFQARQIRPKRTSVAFRLVMVGLGKLFDWRGMLVIVKPDLPQMASNSVSSFLALEIA